MLCCLVQTDSDAVARKRGRFLLQRATEGDAEPDGWSALLQLLSLLEDFAQHLIKVLSCCSSGTCGNPSCSSGTMA